MTNISADARFMRNTGIVLLLLCVLAFAPRYFAPLVAGTYEPPSQWMHSHAISALLWAVIFIIQPWLIVQKARSWHRRIGYAACIVAVINVVTGITVQLDVLPTSLGDFSNIVGGGFRLFHSVPAFIVFLSLHLHCGGAPIGTSGSCIRPRLQLLRQSSGDCISSMAKYLRMRWPPDPSWKPWLHASFASL